MTWGLMYVLHGLAGVGLIALVMIHVYFAIRPEKRDITKSMIFGSMKREFISNTTILNDGPSSLSTSPSSASWQRRRSNNGERF